MSVIYIRNILVYLETLGRHGDNVMKVKVSGISSILLNPIVTKSISPRPYNHSKTIINSKSNMTVKDDRFEGEDDGPNSRIKDESKEPNIFSKKSNKVITAAMQSEEEYENKVLLSPTLLQRQRLMKIKDISTKKVSSAIHLLDMLLRLILYLDNHRHRNDILDKKNILGEDKYTEERVPAGDSMKSFLASQQKTSDVYSNDHLFVFSTPVYNKGGLDLSSTHNNSFHPQTFVVERGSRETNNVKNSLFQKINNRNKSKNDRTKDDHIGLLENVTETNVFERNKANVYHSRKGLPRDSKDGISKYDANDKIIEGNLDFVEDSSYLTKQMNGNHDLIGPKKASLAKSSNITNRRNISINATEASVFDDTLAPSITQDAIKNMKDDSQQKIQGNPEYFSSAILHSTTVNEANMTFSFPKTHFGANVTVASSNATTKQQVNITSLISKSKDKEEATFLLPVISYPTPSSQFGIKNFTIPSSVVNQLKHKHNDNLINGKDQPEQQINDSHYRKSFTQKDGGGDLLNGSSSGTYIDSPILKTSLSGIKNKIRANSNQALNGNHTNLKNFDTARELEDFKTKKAIMQDKKSMLLKFLDDLVDTRKSIPRREEDVGQNLYHEKGSKKEYQEGLDLWTKNDGTTGMIINLLDHIMKDVEGTDLLNMYIMFYKVFLSTHSKYFYMIEVTE